MQRYASSKLESNGYSSRDAADALPASCSCQAKYAWCAALQGNDYLDCVNNVSHVGEWIAADMR